MNRIDSTFRSLRARKKKALIAYLTGGYPSLPATLRLALQLEKAGVDVLEIGVPFSDPIADGPTIQFSSQKALEQGASLSAILDSVARLRRESQIPVVLMSYLNPIHHMGYDVFARRAARAGVDGLIVPDLIPEESDALARALRGAGIHVIFLVAPTTPLSRVRLIARKSEGFLYAVSVTGVTGARRKMPSDVSAFLRRTKKVSRAPVALGFGISGPDAVKELAGNADGVIVGSALIERIRKGRSVATFAASLRRALDQISVGGRRF